MTQILYSTPAATKLAFTTPAAAQGPVLLSVATREEPSAVVSIAFEVEPAPEPVVLYMEPRTGPSTGGTVLKLQVAYLPVLDLEDIVVEVGEQRQGALALLLHTPDQVVFTVSTLGQEGGGEAILRIYAASTGPELSATSTFSFEAANEAKLEQTSIDSCSLSGGTLIVVLGNYHTVRSDYAVVFGAVPGTVQSVRSVDTVALGLTTLILEVPAASEAGSVDVVVSATGDPGVEVSFGFEYLASTVSVESVAPTRGSTLGLQNIIIRLRNFTEVSSVDDVVVQFGSAQQGSVSSVSCDEEVCEMVVQSPPSAMVGVVQVEVTPLEDQELAAMFKFDYFEACEYSSFCALYGLDPDAARLGSVPQPSEACSTQFCKAPPKPPQVSYLYPAQVTAGCPTVLSATVQGLGTIPDPSLLNALFEREGEFISAELHVGAVDPEEASMQLSSPAALEPGQYTLALLHGTLAARIAVAVVAPYEVVPLVVSHQSHTEAAHGTATRVQLKVLHVLPLGPESSLQVLFGAYEGVVLEYSQGEGGTSILVQTPVVPAPEEGVDAKVSVEGQDCAGNAIIVEAAFPFRFAAALPLGLVSIYPQEVEQEVGGAPIEIKVLHMAASQPHHISIEVSQGGPALEGAATVTGCTPANSAHEATVVLFTLSGTLAVTGTVHLTIVDLTTGMNTTTTVLLSASSGVRIGYIKPLQISRIQEPMPQLESPMPPPALLCMSPLITNVLNAGFLHRAHGQSYPP